MRPGENIHNEAERERVALMGGTKREFKRFRREGKLRSLPEITSSPAWSFERPRERWTRDGNRSAWNHEGRFFGTMEGEDRKSDDFWLVNEKKKKEDLFFCTMSELKIGELIYLLLVYDEILYD